MGCAHSSSGQSASKSSASQKRDPSKIHKDQEIIELYENWVKNGSPRHYASGDYELEGIAAWYGPGLNGNKTASGEIFDMYSMTAAHKKLPFGSIVRVKNLRNGKAVIVRINDRGPFTKGRIIDLSYGAAYEVDMIRSGIDEVKVDIIRLGK